MMTVAAPLAAQANSVAARVAAVREGTLTMRFPARPGVCGDGRGSIWVQDGNKRSSSDPQWVCMAGPVVVRLGRSDNETISVRKSVGMRGNTSSADVDLG